MPEIHPDEFNLQSLFNQANGGAWKAPAMPPTPENPRTWEQQTHITLTLANQERALLDQAKLLKAQQDEIAALKEENQLITEVFRRLTNTEKEQLREVVQTVYHEMHPPQPKGINVEALLSVVSQMIQQSAEQNRAHLEELFHAQAIRQAHATTPDNSPEQETPRADPQPAAEQLDQPLPEPEDPDVDTPVAISGPVETPAISSFEPVGGDRPNNPVRRRAPVQEAK